MIPRRIYLLAFTALLMAAQDTTFSTNVKVVNVFATVRDKQGHIVTNLNKDDFTLSEDAHAQTIRYFSRESGLPLTLGLLVDTSGSQRRVLGEERKASYSFLNQVLREDKDQAFVVHFEGEAELLQDLTSSRKKLEAALELLESPQDRPQWGGRGGPGGGSGPRGSGRRGGPGGGTALYDAVLLASDELMKKQQGRKAFIVLSDGVDTASRVSLTSAIESAQRSDTLVYCILFADKDAYGGRGGGFGGLGGPRMGGRGGGMGRGGGGGRPRPQESHVDGKKVLQRLAKETGGGYFEVSSKLPLEQIYTRIEEELRNQYSLGYTPDRTDAPGAFRKILVTTNQKNLVVQARDGYYADHP